jgi:hypothetical protein
LGDDHLGQHAIAAAEVENALAPLRRQQGDDGMGKLRDETRLRSIVIGLPELNRLRRRHLDRTHPTTSAAKVRSRAAAPFSRRD